MLRSSVFAAAAAMALAAGPAYAQVKWDLPSAYPADNFHSENLAAFARDVADRVVFMDEGRVIEQGSPEEVLDRPKHERTQRFLRMVEQAE